VWRHSNGRELPRLRDFWLVATMATMATPGGRPLKNYRPGSWVLVRYHPTSSPLYLFFKIQFRVAMVAMVAMPREYTENDSRQMKLPDARSQLMFADFRPFGEDFAT